MAIKIKGIVVINDSRKLTNIADGSGELSLSGDTLTLSIGGTTQDTQSLQTLTVDEAIKLTTARTITLNGDVSGSTTFDGSYNTNLTTTVANDSHTHDTRYYTESEIDTTLSNSSNWGVSNTDTRLLTAVHKTDLTGGSMSWLHYHKYFYITAATSNSYNLLMTGGGSQGSAEIYADFAQLKWDATNNKFTTHVNMGELFYTHKNAYLASNLGLNFIASTNGGMKNLGYVGLHGAGLMYMWTDGHIRDYAQSDERFKENWNMIDNALDKVNTLDKIGSFTYKDSVKIEDPASEPSEPSTYFGLSAQEMQAILPSSVKNSSQEENDPNTPEWDKPVDVGDILSLDYNAALCLALKAIQELSAKVDALENNSN